MTGRDFTPRPATLEDYFASWPADWPDRQYWVSQHAVQREEYEAFRMLIEAKSSETAIEKHLKAHPMLLAQLVSLFSTGHHGSWLFPKHQLSPPTGMTGGLIPDYVAAGANSDGLSWYVLELKGANHLAFSRQGKRVFLSPEANRGVCQLLNYIDAASRSQSYLRDELKLAGFREPTGILLIGTKNESNEPEVREFKAAWNRAHPQLQIQSYSRLLRLIEKKLSDFQR
jgi:hypothetical protein